MRIPTGLARQLPQRPWRLQSLIRALSLISSVPIIACGAILLMIVLGHRIEAIQAQGRDVAKNVAAGLSSYYEESQRVLALLAQSSSISQKALESEKLTAFFERLVAARTFVGSELNFRDSGGKVLTSTDRLRGEESQPDTLPRAILEQARQRGFALSAGHPDERGTKSLVSAVVPVTRSGDLLGYLSMQQRHGDQLVLQRATIPKGWAVAILDDHHTITAHSGDAERLIGRNARDVLRPEEVSTVIAVAADSSASALAIRLEPLGRYVLVIGPPNAMLARANRYWWGLIGISVLALLGSLLLGYLLARRLTAPLRTLAGEAKQLQFNPAPRAGELAIAEIDNLRDALIASAGQVKEQSRVNQQATARLLAALDAGEIGTWERDAENGMFKWDARTCEIFGVSKPDTWRPVNDLRALVHPDDVDRIMSVVNDRTGQASRGEHRFRILRQGEVRWVHSYRLPPEGILTERRIAGLVRDITDEIRETERISTAKIELERKVAERTVAFERSMQEQVSLQASLLQAQKLEAIGKFGAGAAHNFGNVLTVIRGSLEYLANQSLDAGARLRVERALRSVGAGQRLTDRLQRFARQRPQRAVRLCLNLEINDLVEFARGSVGPSVDIEFAPGPGLWETLLDRSDVESMMMNLIINANDAMPNGGKIRIETQNEPRSTPESDMTDFVRLDVIDNGTGMTADVARRAVEAFFTTKSGDRGTGLGLATIHNSVSSAGGTLEIDSAPGRGTRIIVRFPRCVPAIAAET